MENSNITKLSLTDADYPAPLRQLKNPPAELYVKGNAALLNGGPVVAVVGSRNATAYGLAVTSDFCRDLCEAGFTIITGGARGIDSAAAETALKYGGRLIVVLGCGVDIAYPPENAGLFKRTIQSGGAVISEFPLGTQPLSTFFPRRNRIIAALSDGCVVTEAGLKSGALITADYCLDLKKPIYAVPGNITSASCAGTNNLIRSGAQMAIDGLRVASEIKLSLSFHEKQNSPRVYKPKSDAPKASAPSEPKKKLDFSADEERIIRAIKDGKTTVDEIARETGLSEAALAPIMIMLEIKGAIKREFGGGYTEQ